MIKNKTCKVGVFLATHNSEDYLQEQLSSILQSNITPDALIVSDDASCDSTIEILGNIAPICAEHNIDVRIYKNSKEQRGVLGNFSNLLTLAEDSDIDVFFLCDHDDIWFEDKVARSLAELQQAMLARKDGNQLPVLIFTDLEVVSATGELVASSFSEFQGLPDPNHHLLNKLLYQNVVTGCTVCFNRALLNLAAPLPSQALMHDHWLALCAKVFGQWHYIDQPTLKYRQHARNAVGAKRSMKLGLNSLTNTAFLRALIIFPWHVAQCIEQAKALLQRIELIDMPVPDSDINTIRLFVDLKEGPLRKRVRNGVQWLYGGRGTLERVYLAMLFAILPYLKPGKESNAL